MAHRYARQEWVRARLAAVTRRIPPRTSPHSMVCARVDTAKTRGNGALLECQLRWFHYTSRAEPMVTTWVRKAQLTAAPFQTIGRHLAHPGAKATDGKR